jgi:hypothetical protein
MSGFIFSSIAVIKALAANNTAGKQTPNQYDHDTL